MPDIAIAHGKEMLQAAGVTLPVYIIERNGDSPLYATEEEQEVLDWGNSSVIAWTRPLLCVEFQRGLLRNEWAGPGVCMVTNHSTRHMEFSNVLGMMIHETGHNLDFFTEGFVPDNETGHHSERWLQLTTHLWWRCCNAGYDIPFSEVVNLEQYGFTREQFASALASAQQQEHSPLFDVMASFAGSVTPVQTAAAPQAAGANNGYIDHDGLYRAPGGRRYGSRELYEQLVERESKLDWAKQLAVA